MLPPALVGQSIRKLWFFLMWSVTSFSAILTTSLTFIFLSMSMTKYGFYQTSSCIITLKSDQEIPAFNAWLQNTLHYPSWYVHDTDQLMLDHSILLNLEFSFPMFLASAQQTYQLQNHAKFELNHFILNNNDKTTWISLNKINHLPTNHWEFSIYFDVESWISYHQFRMVILHLMSWIHKWFKSW